MSNSSKNRALVFIIIILLLTNVAVLAYFLWLKPAEKEEVSSPDKNKYKLAEPLKNEVGFSDSQIAEYKKIKDSRSGRVRGRVEDLRRVRDNFYFLLSNKNANDSLLNIASDSIAYRQKLLDLETFAHFKALRILCTPDQEEKYDSMVHHIVHKWGSPIRSSDPKAGNLKKN